MSIDVKHLAHIKTMICGGIKLETKNDILENHSISDQLNATGDELTAIKASIASKIAAGQAKRDSVNACTTFEELDAIVPRAD